MGIYYDPRGCGCYFLSVNMTYHFCSPEHEAEYSQKFKDGNIATGKPDVEQEKR